MDMQCNFLPIFWTKPAKLFWIKKKLHHQFHSRLTRSWLVNSWCFTFFHLLQLTSLFIKRAFCYINDLFPFHLGQLYYVKKKFCAFCYFIDLIPHHIRWLYSILSCYTLALTMLSYTEIHVATVYREIFAPRFIFAPFRPHCQ